MTSPQFPFPFDRGGDMGHTTWWAVVTPNSKCQGWNHCWLHAQESLTLALSLWPLFKWKATILPSCHCSRFPQKEIPGPIHLHNLIPSPIWWQHIFLWLSNYCSNLIQTFLTKFIFCAHLIQAHKLTFSNAEKAILTKYIHYSQLIVNTEGVIQQSISSLNTHTQ